jgi:hypothetical protein
VLAKMTAETMPSTHDEAGARSRSV